MQVNLRASAEAIRLSRWQASLTADLDSCAQKSSPKAMAAFGRLVSRDERLKGALFGHSRDIPFDLVGTSSIGGHIESRRFWRDDAPTGTPAGLQLVRRQSCRSPVKE
jgi:hypothetical protein